MNHLSTDMRLHLDSRSCTPYNDQICYRYCDRLVVDKIRGVRMIQPGIETPREIFMVEKGVTDPASERTIT